MDLFIEIHDRKTNEDLELNMVNITSYKSATITDLDGSSHICIVYKTVFGLIYEEEFDNTSDRDAKLAILADYLV